MSRPRVQNDVIAGALAFFLAVIALMSWSVSSPVAASPDEGYHLASLWCANGPSEGHCEYEGNAPNISRYVPQEVFNWCYQHESTKSAACSYQVIQGSLTNATRSGEATVWFRFLELFSGEPVATHVVFIRLVSSVLSLLLLATTYLISERRHRFAIVLVAGLMYVPHGLYLISASHPSGMVTVLATASIVIINQFIQKSMPRSRMRIAIPLLLISMALLYDIRTEVFGYVALVTILLGTIHWTSTSTKSTSIKVFCVLGGTALASISVAALQKFSPTLLPLTLNVWGDSPLGEGRADWNVLTTNIQNFPSLIIGNFGQWGLGALDVPIPILVWTLITSLIVAVVAISLYFSPGSNIVFFSFMSIFMVWLVLAILQSSKLYVGEEMQPRYILPLMSMLFVVMIANSAMKRPESPNLKFLIFLSVFFASISNSISLWTTLRRYTSGLDSAELDLNFNREWWWNFALDPNQVWAIGTLAFGSAFCIALLHSLGNFESKKTPGTY
jgi:hypothetical protein